MTRPLAGSSSIIVCGWIAQEAARWIGLRPGFWTIQPVGKQFQHGPFQQRPPASHFHRTITVISTANTNFRQRSLFLTLSRWVQRTKPRRFNRSVWNTTVLSGDAYTKSLLGVLDSIKKTDQGSPLFRAYLLSKLVDLMSLRPDAWGLSFCPAVLAHNNKIKAIAGGELADGDWLVPSKVNACSAQLEKFFAAIRAVNYQKQASGLLSLAQTVSKDGLHYAEFRKPGWATCFLSMAQNRVSFGATVPANKEPVPMTAGSQTRLMPLSPLFTIPSGKDLMANAGINQADPSFHNALPPLFQVPSQSNL